MVPTSNLSVRTDVCKEASKKEGVFTLCLHYSEQMAISSQLFVPWPFAWCLFTPHMMAIRMIYRIRGLFGGDFNLVVWQIFIGSPNLNHAILTCTHKMK